MKSKQIKKNNEELIRYLKAKKIMLTSKTLKILSSSEDLDADYYAIFNTSPKIINYFLSNPILWEDEVLNFILEMAKSYDENTILKILQGNLYAPCEFWQYAIDKRIPKSNKKNNYLELISNQTSDEDMQLVYNAFLYPVLRSDDYYLNQVKNLDKDNNRQVLINEVKILEKTKTEILQESLPKVEQQLNSLSHKKGNEVKDIYTILKEYNDLISIKYIASIEDLSPYIGIFQAINKVKNVDEFAMIRQFMVSIINLISRKENIYTSFHEECYIFDCDTIPRIIAKEQAKAFKNGNLNCYLILEQLLEEMHKIIAEPYVLKREK